MIWLRTCLEIAPHPRPALLPRRGERSRKLRYGASAAMRASRFLRTVREFVANPAQREQVLWRARVAFELLAQVPHVHFELIDVALQRQAPPHEGQQPFVRHDTAGVERQAVQDLVLLGRELDRPQPDADLASAEVDAQPTNLHTA